MSVIPVPSSVPKPPPAPWLCVVHLRHHYVVLDKPPGLLSVPGRGDEKFDSIESRVRTVFPHAEGSITVHRLDLETSGLMVAAFTREAHRALSKQFINRKIGKTYVALLQGRVEEDEGAVDLPLLVDWPNRPRQIVNHQEGKPARTLYRVVERDEVRNVTRVEFRPVTGRTHQLRVHAAAPREIGGIGCPILGDTLYGDATTAPRLMLHADFLAFWEPGSLHEWMKFRSDPPF